VPGEVWTRKDGKGGDARPHSAAPADDDADEADGPPPDTCARPLFGRLFPCVDPSTGESSLRPIVPARLWTSTLKRTIDTARHIPHPVLELRQGGVWHQMSPRVYRNLDEIFAGDCEGMTYKEIEETFNEESLLRKRDKLGYRYPRGESYLDLIARLDPLMHELESYTEPLLVVSHQAGQDERAKFPTSKAPISAVFHSFRLIFGRAIISRNGLEAWMLFPGRARAEHSR
jgi:hypothetical protein